MAISDEHLKNEIPPTTLWVVTRERTRAGKPPQKIAPFKWRWAGGNGKPWCVRANKSNQHQDGIIYSLDNCFISLDAAMNDLSRIITEEIAHEDRKLRELKTKLKNARRAGLKIIESDE